MQGNLNQYIKRKKRIRRFWTLLLLSLMMAISAMLIKECNQNLDEPYNKDYHPVDQRQTSNNSGSF